MYLRLEHKFFLFLFSLFFISSVSALPTLGTFQQNKCINLVQTCDNCTYVNLTSVQFPNSSIQNYGVNMQKNSTYYNITFCNTELIGTYIINTVGDDDGFITTGSYSLEVTSTGEQVSLSNSIIVIVFLILAAIFLVLAYSFNKEHWILKTFFNFCAVGMGILAINSARIIASESANLGKMGFTGLVVMITVFSIFFIYIFVYAFIEAIKMFKEKRGVRWEY